MSSTNKTTYYELPQFVDSDLFNPLMDDNDAYSKIDTALHNIAEAEAGDASEIVGVKSRVSTAEGKIEALETQNGNEVLSTTAQTLSGAVNELDTDVASLDGRVDIVEDDINNVNTGLKVKVDNLDTRMEDVETHVIKCEHTYDTVNDLVSDANNLSAGMFVQTCGHTTIDDGGGAIYKVVDVEPSEYHISIGSSLYGILIFNGDYNPLKMGAFSGNVTSAIQYLIDTYNVVHLPAKDTPYLVTTIILHTGTLIYGDDIENTVIKGYESSSDFLISTDENAVGCHARDFKILGDHVHGGIEIKTNEHPSSNTRPIIERLYVFECTTGIKLGIRTRVARIDSCTVLRCSFACIDASETSDNKITNCEVGYCDGHGYYLYGGGNNVMIGNKDYMCGKGGSQYYGVVLSTVGMLLADHVSQGDYYSAIKMGGYAIISNILIDGINYSVQAEQQGEMVREDVDCYYFDGMATQNIIQGNLVEEYGDAKAIIKYGTSGNDNINLNIYSRLGGNPSAYTGDYFDGGTNIYSTGAKNIVIINGVNETVNNTEIVRETIDLADQSINTLTDTWTWYHVRIPHKNGYYPLNGYVSTSAAQADYALVQFTNNYDGDGHLWAYVGLKCRDNQTSITDNNMKLKIRYKQGNIF